MSDYIGKKHWRIYDPSENKYVQNLQYEIDNFDQPVKQQSDAVGQVIVQSYEHFLPPNQLGHYYALYSLGVEWDWMGIWSIPYVWWATATMVAFGPWDAIFDLMFSGIIDGLSTGNLFTDGLSEIATTEFEALLVGLYYSFTSPFLGMSSIYLRPFNLTIYAIDFLGWIILWGQLQFLYLMLTTVYFTDVLYQMSVIFVTKFESACTVLWYNAYFTLSVMTWYFPAFMYNLLQIYIYQDEFEYIPAQLVQHYATLISDTENAEILNRPKWRENVEWFFSCNLRYEDDTAPEYMQGYSCNDYSQFSYFFINDNYLVLLWNFIVEYSQEEEVVPTPVPVVP